MDQGKDAAGTGGGPSRALAEPPAFGRLGPMRTLARVALLAATLIAAPTMTAPLLAQATDTTPTPTASKAADAQAQQQAKPPATMTGEWGGLRTRLRDDDGIDLTAGYTGEFAANVSGGQHESADEDGQFTFGATVDTGKLIGLQGGTVQATITYRQGHDLTERAGLGVLQQVQEIYGRGQTWRLTEFWYQQQFGGGVDLKLGRMVQGGDFASFPCDFQNLSFCGAPVGNIVGYWYNWPVAQWGARLRVKRPDWYVMAGAYENNPRNLDNGFFLSRGGATGVLLPVEAGWTPHLGGKGLPGSYRVGFWYNTSNGNDVLLDVDRRPIAITGAEPLVHSGQYGGYVMIQQQITGTYKTDPRTGPKATHGLSLFFNFTQADRATSVTDSQAAIGLFFTGPFPSRKDDDIGLALARTHVNTRAAQEDGLLAPGTRKPRSEYASELYYSLHVRPWLILRPNVQYVIDPGGYSDRTAVVVTGLKSAIAF